MLMQMVTSSKAEAVSGVEWMEAGYGLTVGPNFSTMSWYLNVLGLLRVGRVIFIWYVISAGTSFLSLSSSLVPLGFGTW